MSEQIRPMQLDDIARILEIEHVCFSTPWSQQSFIEELTINTNAHYYVYVLNDVVIGYVGMWLIFDEIHITNIAIHPAYQHQGHGAKLLMHLKTAAVALGGLRMTLEVRISNVAALALYEKFAFKRAGVRKNYYTHPIEDALILWSDL
jgi:ribosomal-protein-alanine N-acetyltransferase